MPNADEKTKVLTGQMCVRAVTSLGSEHVNNPIQIFWMRPTIPPVASNIKLWLPVDSHVPVSNRLTVGFTPSLLVVAFSHCWLGLGLQTKGRTNPDWNQFFKSHRKITFIYCSYPDEHVGFVCNLFANYSQSASLSLFPVFGFFIPHLFST